MYNILDFGAKNDGVTNSTEAVRLAVAECVKNSGLYSLRSLCSCIRSGFQ